MSKLQKKPSALKRSHPTLQNMNFYKFFFYFCGSCLPSWIRIRIPDPDPLARLNPDPIRIRIRNPAIMLVFWSVALQILHFCVKSVYARKKIPVFTVRPFFCSLLFLFWHGFICHPSDFPVSGGCWEWTRELLKSRYAVTIIHKRCGRWSPIRKQRLFTEF